MKDHQIISLAVVVLTVILLAGCMTTQIYNVSLFPAKEKTISVEGASANELFVRANIWAVSAFKKADAVIEFSDKESGTLIGKYTDALKADQPKNIFVESALYVRPTSMVTIKVKDGKAEITLSLASVGWTDIYGANKGPLGTGVYFGPKAQAELSKLWNQMISDFAWSMRKSTDW